VVTVVEPPRIEFTKEQNEIIERCKKYLKLSNAIDWHKTALESSRHFNQILEDADFPNNDLTPDQLGSLFRSMRVINNRALGNKLYQSNRLAEFNKRLRELLFSDSSLTDRIDQFSELAGIGKMSLTHFLFMLDPMKYPVVTNLTWSVLNPSEEQVQNASAIALRKHSIIDSDDHYDSTMEILGQFEIFDHFRKLLDATDFAWVNIVLWEENSEEVEKGEADVSLATVSLEKDLRKYLATNPHKLGQKFELIGELFNIGEVGEIDILFKDRNGNHIVVETKKGKSSDVVVGQIARYMGWVKRNLGENVRGIIVVSDPDTRLDHALEIIPNTKVVYYRVRFDLSDQPFQE